MPLFCSECDECLYPWDCEKPRVSPIDPFEAGRYAHPCAWCESYDCDLDCVPNDES